MDKAIKTTSRLYYLDNLKGLTILLVVLGHCIQYGLPSSYQDNILYQFIYSFHMALFFVISGFLSYKKEYRLSKVIGKRAYRLLLPYFIWGGIKIIVEGLPFYDILLNVDNHLWFLWSLFFISIITLILENTFGNSKFFLHIVLLSILVFLVLPKIIGIHVCGIKLISYYLQFFLFGFIIKKYQLHNKLSIKHLWLSIPVYLISFVLLLLSNKELIIMCSKMVCSYFGSYSLIVLFDKYLNKRTVMAVLGGASLGIYAIHPWIISFLISYLSVLLGFFVVTGLSLIAVVIIRKTQFLRPAIGEYIESKYALAWKK